MRWILLIALLSITLPLSSSAQSPETGDLAGVYVCDGINPDGSPYKGIVQIAKYRDAFQVQWSFNHEVSAIGIGIRSGNVLAVTYFSGLPGVVAYRIEKGSKLVGEWTVAGADGTLFTETLTKTNDAEAGPAPRHEAPDAQAPSPERRRPRPRTTTPTKGSRDI